MYIGSYETENLWQDVSFIAKLTYKQWLRGGVQVISQAVNLQRGPGLCRSRLTERPGRENFELFDNIGCIRSEGYGIIK